MYVCMYVADRFSVQTANTRGCIIVKKSAAAKGNRYKDKIPM